MNLYVIASNLGVFVSKTMRSIVIDQKCFGLDINDESSNLNFLVLF